MRLVKRRFPSLPLSLVSCQSVQCLPLSLRTGRRRLSRISPWSSAFPLEPPPQHGEHAALFGSFFGTTPMSDCSTACMQGLRPRAFPYRPACCFSAGAAELSRFSNIECPRMLRFYDSAGPVNDWLDDVVARGAFPTYHTRSAPLKGDFGAQWLAYASPVNASRAISRLPAHDSGP